MNCNFTEEPYLKCDRHTGAICMETVCQACHRKAVLLKTSGENLTAVAFSWETGLGRDNWQDGKKSTSFLLSRPVICPAPFAFFPRPSSWQLYSVFLDPDLWFRGRGWNAEGTRGLCIRNGVEFRMHVEQGGKQLRKCQLCWVVAQRLGVEKKWAGKTEQGAESFSCGAWWGLRKALLILLSPRETCKNKMLDYVTH